MELDRRRFLRNMVGGATVAAATTAGITLMPNAAEAAPLALDKTLPQMMEEYAEKAQATVVVTTPRRRRRRRVWRCWWSRGRRVCGWRYVW